VGEIVFGAIAPHGMLAVPEACSEEERGLARATQEGMAELGRRFTDSRPDAVLLFTPHNVHISGHLAVVLAGRVEGSLASWDEGLDHVRLSVPTERSLAAASIQTLRGEGLPVVGVSFGGNDAAEASMPMDWATLIPLWFLGGRSEPAVPAVVVAPARELTAAQHVQAGRALAAAVGASGRRVAVIASADHGHGHAADGPYGFSPASAEYDRQVCDIVGRGALGELEGIDPGFVADAKADSWWQMLMLHGALGEGWQATLLSYDAPTYFGMLCAAFER
jgi:aromatic ring-opening dioxygenase LigB subunit